MELLAQILAIGYNVLYLSNQNKNQENRTKFTEINARNIVIQPSSLFLTHSANPNSGAYVPILTICLKSIENH